MKDYIHVVSELLKVNKYCILNDYVLLTVYYKMITPSSDGKYIGSNEYPEDAYEQNLESQNYTYLSKRDGCVHLHVTSELHLDSLPVECRHLKINRYLINSHLNKSYSLFEEEIYAFITYLNYDPTKIASLLGYSFVDSTRFVPVDLRMCVSEDYYQVLSLQNGTAATDECFFGPKKDEETFLFQPREIEGKISGAKSKLRILSLRDGSNWKKKSQYNNSSSNNNNWVKTVLPYVIYYAVKQKAFIPLAFNPFENPIITSLENY